MSRVAALPLGEGDHPEAVRGGCGQEVGVRCLELVPHACGVHVRKTLFCVGRAGV